MQSVTTAGVLRGLTYAAAVAFAALCILFAALPRSAAHQLDAEGYVEHWYDPQAMATLEDAAMTILNLQPYLREAEANTTNLSTIDQFLIQKEGLGVRATRTGINTFTDWVPSTGGSWVGSTYVPYYGGTTVTTRIPTRQDVSIWIDFAEVDHVSLIEMNNGGAYPWDIHIEANSSAMRQGRWTLLNLRAQRLDQARKFIDAFTSLQAAANGFWPQRFGGMWIGVTNEKARKKMRNLGWDRGGVIVVGVIRGSPAEQVGIRADDIVYEVNGNQVSDSNAFIAALGAALKDKASAMLQLKVFRDGRQFDVAVAVQNNAYGRSWYKERPTGTAASPAPQEWWKACEKGVGEAAIKACTQIIESGNAGSSALLASAHYHRAYGYWQDKKYDLAIADYSRAISLNPEWLHSYAERGAVYLDMDDYDRAIADETEAIRRNPSFDRAYQWRAVAFRRKGEYRKAMDDHDRAIEIDASAWNLSGRCLTYATFDRSLRDALKDCNRALEMDPGRDYILYARAMVYFRDDRFDLALADLNAAIEKDPRYARALYLRGVVRRHLRDEAGAAADIAAALALSPGLAQEFQKLDIE